MADVDAIATQLTTAFATKDLVLLGSLLADDARWGDDDSPNRCRSRADVVATFDRVLREGVDGTIVDTQTGPGGVAVRLHVHWPEPGDAGRDEDFWHAYVVERGVVSEIQRHDDRRSAVAAISRGPPTPARRWRSLRGGRARARADRGPWARGRARDGGTASSRTWHPHGFARRRGRATTRVRRPCS